MFRRSGHWFAEKNMRRRNNNSRFPRRSQMGMMLNDGKRL